MKRILLATMALLIFLFSAYSQKAPGSQRPDITTTVATSKAFSTSSPLVAEGIISKIKPTGKNLAIVWLRAGKTIVEFTLDSRTKIRGGEGKTVLLSTIKKGERVKIDYKPIGKYDIANLLVIVT